MVEESLFKNDRNMVQGMGLDSIKCQGRVAHICLYVSRKLWKEQSVQRCQWPIFRHHLPADLVLIQKTGGPAIPDTDQPQFTVTLSLGFFLAV